MEVVGVRTTMLNKFATYIVIAATTSIQVADLILLSLFSIAIVTKNVLCLHSKITVELNHSLMIMLFWKCLAEVNSMHRFSAWKAL